MNTKQKITVIVNGRFHTFDYAAELHKLGLLDKLISTMPYSKAEKFGIPKEKYVGFPVFEAAKYIGRKVFGKELPPVYYSKLFNKAVLRKIPKTTDVIISFAGYSKEIFEEFPKKLKVLDRSSTHTLANIELKQQAADYHGFDYTPHPKAFIDRELAEYDMADYILVPSDFVKKTFTDHGVSEEKMILNPYVFSTKKFSNTSKNVKEKAEQTILYVGQMSPRKGTKVLVDAFEHLKKELPETKLWMVGSLNGVERELLNKEGITYFGTLRGDELKDKYERASLFCLAAYEEGLAYVLTEANYFNLPIVATPNSGVETLKKGDDNYLTFEAGNYLDLSAKLNKVLSSLELYQSKENKSKSKTWKEYTGELLNALNITNAN